MKSENPVFTGAGVAIVTPFDENNKIDRERFEELINFHITNSTDAIIVCGTTGESSTLSEQEHIEAIDIVVKLVGHRIPVIAGAGSNSTDTAIMLSKEAERLGADAVLHVTPYYNKTTQDGLVAHFGAISDAIGIPMILYNIPGRTGMNIDIPTYARLAEIPNIVAVKEASGNISYCAKLLAKYGEALDVYSGNDDMIVPIMSLGGKGVISVLSNILPFTTHKMCQLCLDNNFEEANKYQLSYLDLIDALFCETNPIPVKTAMRMLCSDCGPTRLPLVKMKPEHEEILRSALSKHKLLGFPLF